jgi:hypothetical protein
MAINAPTLASLAPGVPVFGMMVSATSSKKAMSFSERLTELPYLSLALQPLRKNSAPITVPPTSNATRFSASLLFIQVDF